MTTQSNRYNSEAIQQAQNGFRSSLGSGTLALKHATFLLGACAEHRDTTSIVKMVQAARADNRQDQTVSTLILKLARVVFPGMKASKDKQGAMVLKIKGINPVTDIINSLEALVEENKSIRSKEVKNLVSTVTVTKTFDAKKWAEGFVSRHNEQEVIDQKAKLTAQLAALEAAQKVNTSKAVANPSEI